MYSGEGHAGDERQLLQGVQDVLDRAGFRMRDGDFGLTVVSTAAGVRVGWGEGRIPLRTVNDLWSVGSGGLPGSGYSRGLNTAMVVAVAAVLRQAGYRVRVEDVELIVAADG